ncbi:MAG: DUF1640 domain-containing protein [Nitrospinae bacterium]|nr:DUF1640 domain-containing protein [Nitrospinota bacterium]
MPVTFDTLAYANKLKSVGVPEKQAEVQAETLADLVSDQLVTKEHFDRSLKELELRLKYDLTMRLGGMMAASIAVVAALVKLF